MTTFKEYMNNINEAKFNYDGMSPTERIDVIEKFLKKIIKLNWIIGNPNSQYIDILLRESDLPEIRLVYDFKTKEMKYDTGSGVIKNMKRYYELHDDIVSIYKYSDDMFVNLNS